MKFNNIFLPVLSTLISAGCYAHCCPGPCCPVVSARTIKKVELALKKNSNSAKVAKITHNKQARKIRKNKGKLMIAKKE